MQLKDTLGTKARFQLAGGSKKFLGGKHLSEARIPNNYAQ